MILPEELNQTFWEELKIYGEDRQMPYVTSVEQIGYDRGIQIGVENERDAIALNIIRKTLT